LRSFWGEDAFDISPKEDTMLESYFKLDHTLRRLRAEPTGRYMDGFAKTLHTKGYGLWAGQAYLRAAAHLGMWIKRHGFSVMKLDKEVIREFAGHLPSCHCLGKNRGIYDDAVIGARHFLDHLKDAGVVQASAPLEKPPLPTIIDGFEQWMRQHRGVCESTLTPYRSILIKLLGAVGDVPGKYNAHFLRRGVELQTSRCGRSWAKLVITTVRMFLRYLVVHNLCDPALVDALPTIAHWKRASCPDYLPKEEVEKLIVACNPTTAVGARDRAVLLLLIRLGLRAGDIVHLRHADIDWEQGALQVTGKGRRRSVLPLPQDAGDAILTYLEHWRPDVRDEHIFLRVNAPFVPLAGSSAVSSLVNRAARRARLAASRIGAHLLRHTAASLMLQQGVSLQTIGGLLRHQSLDTTALYAKIDVGMLSDIAQPWPGEVSPC
jgi:integrase/recombinase XerD